MAPEIIIIVSIAFAVLGFTAYFVVRRLIKRAIRITVKAHETGMKNLSAIISAADVGILIKDKQGKIVEWNVGAENILGYTRKEMLGKTSKDIAPLEMQEEVDLVAARLLKGESIAHTDVLRIHKDGSVMHGSVSYSPVFDDYKNIIGSVSVFHDISERVKKDRELQKAYRDTEAIIAELPVPICVVSRENGNILGCNRAFVSICGAESEDELLDKHIETYLANTGAEEPLTVGSFKGFLNKRDGTTVEVEVFSKPLVYKTQRAYIVCCIDVTQQAQQEESLREAAQSAEETSRLKTMFLANMSHEIRTPMNGIIGLTELALDDENLSEKTADYLRKIRNSGTGLLAIINDILDISKIEAGKVEMEKVAFLFDSIIKSCKAEAAIFNVKSEDVSIAFDYEELMSVRVLGDPTKLRQIFMNLLSNALKFTEAGTVELIANIISMTAQDITVNFQVRDTGIGMSEAQIKKIFEPFAQADTSTTRKYGGTGLGLTITLNLLELMGGELIVESEPGKGSTFGFTLTFRLADEVAAPAVDMSSIDDAGKKPIFNAEALVCEDNAINRQVIEEHLTRIGINPIIAENGKLGVNMARARMRMNKPFDIILMDIHMPVMDGMEAMQKLIEAENKTPVIAMTANAMREDRELFIESGMVDYISKPFSARDLWQCLMRYLTPVRFEEASASVKKYTGGIIDAVYGLEKSAGDPDLYKKIKTDFYFDNICTAQKIKDALSGGDSVTAHRLTHTLKGVATLIGAVPLSEAAYTLEKIYGETKTDEQALTVVEEQLELVLNELMADAKAERGGEQHAEIELDISKARELIGRLELLLEDGNSDVIDLVDEIKVTFPRNLCRELVELISDYEFEEAQSALEALKRRAEVGVLT